ncbi:unnamed protein product [Porites lobata]|uniref:DNA-directed DNA polymerase n=1 Tax=Porites lobata TaxID=104759 RepID=A0ABN8QTJ1_9CNID|nr:unnamed protein product [Porites lobata]
MSQSLATHGFSWMKDLTIDSVIDLLDKKRNPEVKKGYIFEVDLVYPHKLWKSHNDYPLAPEKMNVNGVEKLICHFKPRKNYVVHYRNLGQYLEMGMRLTAVHRGTSFNQSSWMEPYIRKNTELRKTAANSFEKDFFKLMNNSVFGKTIENIRKRQNIILVDNREKASKLISRPNFDRATIFDRNLIAVHMKKTEVYFNKPVYVGQAILDLSKTLMFNFHYNYIQKKYKHRAELLFTDTDSLMYQIHTDDFYKDISKDIETKFDTSDYPPDYPSGILTGVNKKVIGMFEDEVAGKQITYFVGLRPKLYSFKIEESKEVRKCKGYNICDSCGSTNCHVLGYFDLKEYDRFHFRKKSIYQRKYHYEKKVDQVSKSLHLAEDENCELYNKLMNIDEHVMEILNNQFCRKRMISIFYLIKKFLEEMANEKSKLVYLKIFPQTLVNYEKWWNSYINLKK